MRIHQMDQDAKIVQGSNSATRVVRDGVMFYVKPGDLLLQGDVVVLSDDNPLVINSIGLSSVPGTQTLFANDSKENHSQNIFSGHSSIDNFHANFIFEVSPSGMPVEQLMMSDHADFSKSFSDPLAQAITLLNEDLSKDHLSTTFSTNSFSAHSGLSASPPEQYIDLNRILENTHADDTIEINFISGGWTDGSYTLSSSRDAVDAGAGDDTINISNSTFSSLDSINGGADSNTLGLGDILNFIGSNQTLDLTALNDTAIQNIEIIDLTGNGNNHLLLGINDVLSLSNTTDNLIIKGDETSHVTINTTSGGWTQAEDQVLNGSTYHVYVSDTEDNAQLYINANMMITLA